MIDLMYLSLSSDALNIDLFSLYSGILHVPHCSPFAIVSRFVRLGSTRSNWSHEKLEFISVRARSSLRGKAESVVRGSVGVCERRRGVRIVVVHAIEVSGTCPFMHPGSLSVMLAVICFTAAFASLEPRPQFTEKPQLFPGLKRST